MTDLKFKKSFAIAPIKHNALITLTFSKKDYKKQYTLRARIGIRIAQLLGIVELILKD